MKKSQLHKIIKEELQAVKEAGQVNPELDRTVNQFVAQLTKKYGHRTLSDAVMAIFEAMKRLGLIDKSVDYKAADTLSEVGPAYKTSSFTKTMTPDTFALYQEYAQKIDVFDRSAIFDHDTLQKVMLNDPRVQKSNQKFLLQTALGWAMTFAQEMER